MGLPWIRQENDSAFLRIWMLCYANYVKPGEQKAMKKFMSLILALCLLIGGNIHSSIAQNDFIDGLTDLDIASGFTSLSDPNLLQYIEDTTYSSLAGAFSSDDYIIKEVNAIYISNEYLEELEFNSKTNVFFGYSLTDLDERFVGTRYAFMLGSDGATTVEVLEFAKDETYNQILENVAIGTGAIVLCVTVSVVSAGLGAPAAVSAVFAASAKVATTFAIKGAAFGGITAGIVKGIETNNFDEAVKAAALAGSEGFKWGAITGAVSGGVKELNRIRTTIPSPRASELKVLKQYKGTEQVSYLNGKEVPYATPGSTRPDVVRKVGDLTEFIEVKNYDLSAPTNRKSLVNEVYRQVTDRAQNLPKGSLQRVVLDVQGRQYPKTLVDDVVQSLKNACSSVYSDLPIDVIRW